jgi:hypothetical protein
MLDLIREYFGEHRVIVGENDSGEFEVIDLEHDSLISGSAKACLAQVKAHNLTSSQKGLKVLCNSPIVAPDTSMIAHIAVGCEPNLRRPFL